MKLLVFLFNSSQTTFLLDLHYVGLGICFLLLKILQTAILILYDLLLQKKKYDRVKRLDDDEEDDDEKDLIADEIFHGDAEGELEEGEAVEETLQQADDDEEGEDEESGWKNDH